MLTRYSLPVRRIARARSFAVLAVVTLTVGIGANASMFALTDALLFRAPFGVGDPERVVSLRFRMGDSTETAVVNRCDYPTFALTRNAGVFAAVSAYVDASVSVGRGSEARIANGMLVSRDFFRVLQPQPLVGEFDIGDGESEGAEARVAISYGFWQRHFAGEGRALGAQLMIDERGYTVVAIAKPGFQGVSQRPVDVWLPLNHVSLTKAAPKNCVTSCCSRSRFASRWSGPLGGGTSWGASRIRSTSCTTESAR